MDCIYAGSFDPFTKGHLEIIKQTSPLFNKVHVVFAINSEKKRTYSVEDMIKAFNSSLLNLKINNCSVISTDKLIADLAKDIDCRYLVRGLRDFNDYNYEENIAKINITLNPDLKVIYFRAKDEIISSSFVKELIRYNKDISKYVTPEVESLMRNNCPRISC